jgi:hypothetical protein
VAKESVLAPEREAGERLALASGEARHGALADAFTEGGDDLDLLFAREGRAQSFEWDWPEATLGGKFDRTTSGT